MYCTRYAGCLMNELCRLLHLKHKRIGPIASRQAKEHGKE